MILLDFLLSNITDFSGSVLNWRVFLELLTFRPFLLALLSDLIVKEQEKNGKKWVLLNLWENLADANLG